MWILGVQAPAKVYMPDPGDRMKDAWVVVFVGCLLWLQVGTVTDARMGLGWWHRVWVKNGHGCPGVEGAMHEWGWGLCWWGEQVMLRGRRHSWRHPQSRSWGGSLGVPSSAPWLWAGGALPLQAAPLAAKPHG